ncbi:MAG: hypothetical protein HOP21_02970 [Methylotenera sp.]|nr:hypothetical protein [Methylotenera sp.]
MVNTIWYWIRDTDKTPQHLPLQKLLRAIVGKLNGQSFELNISRSCGYGMQIREWDLQLESNDKIPVMFDILDKVCSGESEWFYFLEAECVSKNLIVYFGLHDSSALYIDAPEEFSTSIARLFIDVTEQI